MIADNLVSDPALNDIKISIVIPAHNEAPIISDCLAAIQTANDQLPSLIQVNVLVVLDSCTDNTLELVKAAGVDYLSYDYRCVGQVRDIGIRHAINQGATWIACTDADSVVPKDWLAQQISHIMEQPTDMICGVVSIEDWDHLTAQTKKAYLDHYENKMGHRHIHGANLSFSSKAYLAVGGFAPLPCHEDVNLVKKFKAQGFAITWSNQVRVVTSSRLEARTSDGFAGFLGGLEKNSSQ